MTKSQLVPKDSYPMDALDAGPWPQGRQTPSTGRPGPPDHSGS